jgi:hypothetical protein
MMRRRFDLAGVKRGRERAAAPGRQGFAAQVADEIASVRIGKTLNLI